MPESNSTEEFIEPFMEYWAENQKEGKRKKRVQNRKKLVYILPIVALFFSFCIIICFSVLELSFKNGKFLKRIELNENGFHILASLQIIDFIFLSIFIIISILFTCGIYVNLFEKTFDQTLQLLKIQAIIFTGALVLTFVISVYVFLIDKKDTSLSTMLVGSIGLYLVMGFLGFIAWAFSNK